MTVVPPAARVRAETVIVWPLVETVPTVADVHPTALVVTGADHPDGTAIVTVPPLIAAAAV